MYKINVKEYRLIFRNYEWYPGEFDLDIFTKELEKIIGTHDFTAFTKSQVKHFGAFPVDEYHYFFQITPFRSYHGVEHTKNTVLLLGPGNEIMDKRYELIFAILMTFVIIFISAICLYLAEGHISPEEFGRPSASSNGSGMLISARWPATR